MKSHTTKENAMLQKLENAYLAILRFVVIVVAGMLLVAVAILGFNSFKVFQAEPALEQKVPRISDRELIQEITAPQTAQPEPPSAPAGQDHQADKNSVFYARAANAIVKFVAQHSGGTEAVEKPQAMAIIKSRAEAMGEPALIAGYAENLADTIERILAAPSVIEAAQTTSTLAVVNSALKAFTEKFSAKVEQVNTGRNAQQQAYLEKKAEGLQSLYIAAGAFGSFLMIVFLSVIIRIERNLRHLENRPIATT
jgi:hypothetical protein